MYKFLWYFVLLIISSVNISCFDKDQNQRTEHTLDVFVDEVDTKPFKRSYESNMIERLFNEALEKDDELGSLVKEIGKIDGLKSDSLNAFNTYSRNNTNYWSETGKYFMKIKDTLLRNELTEKFANLEKNYNDKIASLDNASKQLEEKANLLSGYETVLKLFVSQKIIENYQDDEFPSIQTIQDVSENYDSLIKEVIDYIEE